MTPVASDESIALGAVITALRQERELTVDELARKLGTSRQMVIAWGKGRNVPSSHYEQALRGELGGPDPEMFEQARSAQRRLLPAEADELWRRVRLLEEALRRAGIPLPPANGGRDANDPPAVRPPHRKPR